MAKSLNNWLILGGLFLLGIVAFAATAAEKVSFGTPRIVTGVLNWINSNLIISIPIINNLGLSANLNDFTGQLFYGASKIADMRLVAPVTIAADATSEFEIIAVAKNTDIIQSIIFNVGKSLQLITIVGTVTINGSGFPLEQKFDLNDFV